MKVWKSADGLIELHNAESFRFLADLAAERFDAVITDPPYSSGGFTRGDRSQSTTSKYIHSGTKNVRQHFSGDNRDARSWSYWCNLWISECHRLTRENGYFLTFIDWRQLPLASDAVQAGGFVWRGVVPWDKGLGARAPHTGYFRHQCEYVLWGTKGVSKPAKHGGPWPGFFQCTVRQSDKFHQTGKPTELMVELVQCVPKRGRIIDPFAGSATTLVAAMRTGRRAIGVEQSPEIFETAVERLEREQAELLTAASGGRIRRPPAAAIAARPRARRSRRAA